MCFATVEKAGKMEGLPSAFILRRMVKNDECPGFYSGRRFYIDIEKLREQITVKGGAGGGQGVRESRQGHLKNG